MRSTYQIIDDKGRVWHEASLALRANNDGFVAGEGFLDYAIRNLGFIAIRRVDGDGVELRLRLDCVSEAALIAASYQISDGAPTRIALTHWESGAWRFELHLGIAQLMARLARSKGLAKAGRQKRTLRAERSLDALMNEDYFLSIAQAWESAKPHIGSAGFMSKLVALSNNRYIVYEKDPVVGFKVASFGANQPEFALKWLGSGQSTLNRHPDIEYAWECERAFSVAIEREFATLEEIDAFVQWHSGSRGTPMRRQYQRLLLPLLGGPRHGLISITRENSAIDLRAGGKNF